ncbi:leukocyte tyrosine kinase receptor-like [Procambarus clarkii]|uniref:leukocyte tyrosine kinase receptor-like n=1 Tax=Procambarus clarkii TaxID=6728 RepID=UPI003743E053
MVTTCGATGHDGPSPEDCQKEYQDRPHPKPSFPSSGSLPGTQTWTVPNDGYYTILAKGASGGAGIQTQGKKTHGAIARGTFYLTANTELYILVGQEGLSACDTVSAHFLIHFPSVLRLSSSSWFPFFGDQPGGGISGVLVVV